MKSLLRTFKWMPPHPVTNASLREAFLRARVKAAAKGRKRRSRGVDVKEA
jgi:hypothetical protein